MLTGSRKKGNIENKPVSFPGLLPELKEEGGNLKDKRCDGKRILPAATQGGNKKGNQWDKRESGGVVQSREFKKISKRQCGRRWKHNCFFHERKWINGSNCEKCWKGWRRWWDGCWVVDEGPLWVPPLRRHLHRHLHQTNATWAMHHLSIVIVITVIFCPWRKCTCQSVPHLAVVNFILRNDTNRWRWLLLFK